MTQLAATKLLTIVDERQCLLFEELLTSFPELTWNQVFSLVDELSRAALICLRRRGFEYELERARNSTSLIRDSCFGQS